MENKRINIIFSVIVAIIALGALGLSIFYSSAFIPMCMLMTSLFLFSIGYYVKDEKKTLLYILFILGVILIIASIIYTTMRLS